MPPEARTARELTTTVSTAVLAITGLITVGLLLWDRYDKATDKPDFARWAVVVCPVLLWALWVYMKRKEMRLAIHTAEIAVSTAERVARLEAEVEAIHQRLPPPN